MSDLIPRTTGRPSILIYNTSLLGQNEVELWRCVLEPLSNTCHAFFFSTSPKPVGPWPASHFIQIGRSPEGPDPSGLGDDLTALVDFVAEKDKVWENFHPEDSPRRAASWLAYWTLAVRAIQPASIYAWNGNDVPGSALCSVGRKVGIPATYLERGPFGRTFVRDDVGINAASSFVQLYDSLPGEIDRRLVQSFREMYFASGVSNWEQPAPLESRRQFLQQHEIRDAGPLIFFPCQVDRDTNTKLFSPHYRSSLEALAALVRCCRESSRPCTLLVKTHPRQDYEPARVREVLRDKGVLLEHAHAFDCIRFSDAVVSLNSSIAVEAALFGKPVLLLGESILSRNQLSRSLESRAALHAEFENLLSRAEARENQVDELFFSRLLGTYLYTASPALRRIGIADAARLVDRPSASASSIHALSVDLLLSALGQPIRVPAPQPVHQPTQLKMLLSRCHPILSRLKRAISR